MFPNPRKPDFSVLETTLRGGWAGRVPLLELGIHPEIKQAVLGRPIVTVADDVEFMSSMGYDFIKIQPVIRFALDRKHAGAQVDRAWVSGAGACIETMADFEAYPWPRAEEISYARLEEAPVALPDGMKVIGQYGDIFTTAWELMGFENFSVACYEEPELIDALFDKIGGLIMGMYDVMAQMEWVGALWYSDDIAYTSGLMVSPAFLRQRFFPMIRRMASTAAAHGKPFLYHTDGRLYDILEDIIGAGVNGLHPIEPLAMDIVDLKDRVGSRLCLCGNIDVDLLARGTPAEIESLVQRRLEALSGRGGYCLGSSNSVPDYAKVENYLAMVRTAAAFQG